MAYPPQCARLRIPCARTTDPLEHLRKVAPGAQSLSMYTSRCFAWYKFFKSLLSSTIVMSSVYFMSRAKLVNCLISNRGSARNPVCRKRTLIW